MFLTLILRISEIVRSLSNFSHMEKRSPCKGRYNCTKNKRITMHTKSIIKTFNRIQLCAYAYTKHANLNTNLKFFKNKFHFMTFFLPFLSFLLLLILSTVFVALGCFSFRLLFFFFVFVYLHILWFMYFAFDSSLK